MNRQTPILVALACGASLAAGCQEAPSVGRAAAPSQANSRGPVMGSTTTNEDLTKKIEIVELMLDGKIDPRKAAEAIDKEFGDLDPDEQTKRVATLADALKEASGLAKGGKVSGPKRDMVVARLYFAERRFIESGMLLSKVLDSDPVFPGARNLLARCFYFLGNPDRTIVELDYILNHPEQSKNGDEVLDALFLIGAAVVEQPGTSRQNLEKGLWAWEAYLKEAPESPQRPQVEKGLEELRAGLRGEGRLAQAQITKKQAAMSGGQNVMGGQGSFQGAATGGPPGGRQGPPPEHVKNLPPDASPFDRQVATALDKLESGDLAGAEPLFNEAAKAQPSHPDVMVGLARIYVQTGRTDEGLQKYGETIRRHPNHMPAWHYNGMAHMMGNDPKQAAESWEHILKVDPAYAKKFSLDRRAKVARRMASGR